MLLPAEMLPLLFHEDASVRRFAVDYLVDGHDPAPLTADVLWAAVDHVGGRESLWFTRRLSELPTTPGSHERLLVGLRSEPDDDVFHHLVRTLERLPGDALRRALGDRRIARRLPAIAIAELTDVLRLSDRSFDDLWEEMANSRLVLKYEHYLVEPDSHRMNRLGQAISRFPEQAAGRALDALLDAPVGQRTRWVQAFSVRLLRYVRHPAALVPLLAVLRDERPFCYMATDWAEEALVHLGTREVVAALAAGFPGARDWLWTHGSAVLSRIKRPESEQALVRLLAATSDVRRCTRVGIALCDLCTTSSEAIDRLRALVSCEHFDPYQGALDEAVLTLSAVQGFQPIEAPFWRGRIAAREAALEEATERRAWSQDESGDDPAVDAAATSAAGDERKN